MSMCRFECNYLWYHIRTSIIKYVLYSFKNYTSFHADWLYHTVSPQAIPIQY